MRGTNSVNYTLGVPLAIGEPERRLSLGAPGLGL
jgi:hypothetical protein